MRSRRWLALAAFCQLAIFFVFVCGCHRRSDDSTADNSAQPPTVSVVTVRTGFIASQLTVAGVFQPFQEVDVHGKVSGYIRHIYVDIGDRVRQGQTLAVLEVPELQAEVAGAQAGVTQTEETIQRLREEVAREQAGYAAVHANYLRLKQASDQQPGLVAAQELEDALAKDQTAAAQVSAAKSAVAASQGQLGVSRAESQRVSSMEQYATITAPYNGVVTMRYADTGALIPAGTAEGLNQAVVRLAQSDLLRLRMPVPERDVPMVHIGSVVSVHVQATGQQFAGTVVRFSRDVSNTTRTMMTEVDVKNPDLTLTPGMYADVTFNLEEKKNALIVPAVAVIPGDQPAVMLIDSSNQVEKRSVELGISGSNQQEVTSGLSPGDRVVIGGSATLQPGEKVNPQQAPNDLVEYQGTPEKGGK
ncbi:RND family efflux transporter MFP subunit [Silvibacterium bohemicum]|uniref:RND family efflux transporter MFP subunit n=1 Tax=Silvibacterium bohemicum TaxID=1577686 RepID=A0A841JVY9_9BACT|nr:efflux RND transporter periplasmic adaptor subunit [Silvibacterium bohemicum]MBB6143909.1 RND family efflux transporter MFP subunit [Silvibacterium bohemicum]